MSLPRYDSISLLLLPLLPLLFPTISMTSITIPHKLPSSALSNHILPHCHSLSLLHYPPLQYIINDLPMAPLTFSHRPPSQAILNPCVSVCFYVFGALDVFQLTTQLLAHYYAATIGWSLIRYLTSMIYSHDTAVLTSLNEALVGPSYTLLSQNSQSYISYAFGGTSAPLFPITVPLLHVPGGLPTAALMEFLCCAIMCFAIFYRLVTLSLLLLSPSS